MTDPKKPSVAFWATVVLIVVLVYVLCIGPVLWLQVHVFQSPIFGWVFMIYGPLFFVAKMTGQTKDLLQWYFRLWVDGAKIAWD